MKWTYFAIALVAVLYLLESNNVIDVDGNRTGESTSAIVQAIEQGSSQKPVNNIHEKWKADTAMYFYQSLSLYNYPHAAKYVTEPKIILAMKEGHGRLTVKENSYHVKEVNEEGVVMLFSRFCYPDLESMVYMERL